MTDTGSTVESGMRRVHIVGIGGAGMSGIARIMVAQGITVSGTDAKDSRRLQALRAIGVDARIGHDAGLIHDIDALVVSTAIPEANAERVAARERGVVEFSRAEALAEGVEEAQVEAIDTFEERHLHFHVLHACIIRPRGSVGVHGEAFRNATG